MIITIEGIEYKIPATLSEITLNERIEFDRVYGKDLREQRKTLIENEEGETEYLIDAACKALSFYGKIDLEIVQQTAIEDVLVIQREVLHEFTADFDFNDPEMVVSEIEWKGETWMIAPPELTNMSEMKFGEFLDSKQSVQNCQDQGEEIWGALLPLCCIYLRKKGEKYTESLLTGEREKLMKTLPLDHAMRVFFFSKFLTPMSQNISPCSGRARESLVAGL